MYADHLFTGHFIAGPGDLPLAEGWSSVAFADGFNITVPPGTSTTEIHRDNRRIFCIGRMLQPDAPQSGDREIAADILDRSVDFDSFERVIRNLAGRWLIVIMIHDELRIYPDAMGLYPLFRHVRNGAAWFATLPGLFEHFLGLAPVRNHPFRKDNSKFGVGQLGYFDHTDQLIPNHYFTLGRTRITRFWPDRNLPDYSLEDAAAIIAERVTSILKAAAARSDVYLPFTGGYDSRLIFACAVGAGISCKTFCFVDPDTPSYDVTLPRRISRAYGMDFTAIHIRDVADDFVAGFNLHMGHSFWDPSSIKLETYDLLPPDVCLLHGVGGEFVRGWGMFEEYYRKYGANISRFTPEKIADICDLHPEPAVLDAIRNWRRTWPQDGEIDYLDLIYAEHRIGNWGALGVTSSDNMRPVIPVFNHRDIIEAGLGLDRACKQPPDYRLAAKILELTCPELLEHPFNSDRRSRIADWAHRRLPWRLQVASNKMKWRLKGLKNAYRLKYQP